MSFNRQEFADNIVRLKDNAHFGYYVNTLKATYADRVEALLNSDHPDEALRGECRAYLSLIKKLQQNSGNTP